MSGILKGFGLGDPYKSHEPSTCDLPGQALINNDERVLCTTQTSNGTYPRLARLSDGSILASFTRREDNERVLRISKSTDGGQRFVDFGEVTRGVGDIDNAYLLEVSPSTMLVAFRNHDLAPDGSPTYFRITVCQSTDGGRSWTFLSQAAEKPAPWGLWEPFMRIGRRGEVQLTFSQEFAADDQRTMLVVSHDQGRSWTRPRCVESRENHRDGMTGIAATRDSSDGRDALVMVFETNKHGGTFHIEAVMSYDDGASWQHRHEVFVPPRGHNAGAPQIASFADGSLAVVFMTDEDSPRVDWPRQAAIKAVFAGPPRGGKIRWCRPMLVSHGPSFWPGIMALDHHTALAAYDFGGPRAKSITWRRQ